MSGSVVLELTPVASAKKTRRRRLSLLLGISLALLVTSGAVYSALPLVRMRMAKATAMACLAGYDKPRGPKLPDCSAPIQEFSKLARVSYVHHDATYRAEELWARIMVAEYENASIGSPDPKVRNDTAKFVDDAETVLDKGSQRILLDELGQVIAAPHLGQLASSLGDRRTLVDHFDWWSQWSVRVHAIRAALVEGDLGKASQIARRYYDWDPRDPDLRTMMGAVLCLGDDPARGLELLTRIPSDRADKRYAAIARNYGEVLSVMQACAKKAKLDVPVPPQVSHAGVADVEEARLVADIRLAKLPALVHEASDKIVVLLQEEHRLDHSPPSTRAMLLGAIAAYDDRFGDENGPLSASIVLRLASPTEVSGNDRPLGPFRLTPRDLLSPSGSFPLVAPVLSATALGRASGKLELLATHPVRPSDEGDAEKALRRAALALRLHAAIASALAGDSDAALRDVDDAARLASDPPRETALTAASLAYVAGDGKRALERLAGGEGDEPATEASLALVGALAHASLGEREPAHADLARAILLAPKANDPELTLDARWLELALSDAPAKGSPLAPPTYTGMADPLLRWRAIGEPALDAELGAWRAASGASDEERLGFRYALMHVRGDAPAFAATYMAAAARLMPAGSTGPAIEVWLDALTAADLPRVPVSSYVWSRWEAARMRGDDASARLWQKRLGAVRAMKSAEPDLEIARFIGL